MKNVITTIAFLFAALFASAQGQGTGALKVTVLDENLKPFPGVVTVITAGGPQIGGTTDLDGHYTFRSLTPGSYDVECRMMGYKNYRKTAIQVTPGQTAYAEYRMQLKTGTDTTSTVIIRASQSPVDPTFSTIQSINAQQVKRMAVDKGNVLDMVTGTCSSCNEGKDGGLIMRGSREGASAVFVDGEKMYGTGGVPGLAIAQVSVLSGGIPAEYGDLTGGAVIITTHSYYSGMAAKENMYQAAAEEKAAEEKAQAEKSGKRKENTEQIIEQSEPADDSKPENESSSPAQPK